MDTLLCGAVLKDTTGAPKKGVPQLGRSVPLYCPPHHPDATELAHAEEIGLFAVLRQFVVCRWLEEFDGPHQAAQQQGQRGHAVLVQALLDIIAGCIAPDA